MNGQIPLGRPAEAGADCDRALAGALPATARPAVERRRHEAALLAPVEAAAIVRPVPEEEVEETECEICMELLGAENTNAPCGRHAFHTKCLDTWLERCVRRRLDASCPVCREVLST